MVQALILLPLFLFLTLYGIELGIVVVRHQVLVHAVHRTLTRSQIDGQIAPEQVTALKAALQQFGLDPQRVQLGSRTTLIGVLVPRGGTITLEVGYPRGALTTGRLVGLPSWDAQGLMWVRASIISEKVVR